MGKIRDSIQMNFIKCYGEFSRTHPKEPLEMAELCDAGAWNCPGCPWKDSAPLHMGAKK